MEGMCHVLRHNLTDLRRSDTRGEIDAVHVERPAVNAHHPRLAVAMRAVHAHAYAPTHPVQYKATPCNCNASVLRSESGELPWKVAYARRQRAIRLEAQKGLISPRLSASHTHHCPMVR